MTVSGEFDGFSITLNRESLDRLIAARVKYVAFHTAQVDMAFDLAALLEIQKQTAGPVVFSAKKASGFTGDTLAAIGARPAYDLSVTGRGKTITDLGAGRVGLALAYTPAEGERTDGLYLVRAGQGGAAEWLFPSGYESGAGRLTGAVDPFSTCGVGYKDPPAFADTVNHWARTDIEFVTNRGLMSGTGETAFTPEGSMTRGMFVVVLGRLAGIDPAAYSSGRFTDVPAVVYYAPYVAWAADKGIVNGTGADTFNPDRAVTREEMAAIMQRYSDKLGYTLPVTREAERFADDGQIDSSFKDAVQAMQQAGIMTGKSGRRFTPKEAATRAEAAAVLRRFAENVIDRRPAGV